jgi:hypothetical protein
MDRARPQVTKSPLWLKCRGTARRADGVNDQPTKGEDEKMASHLWSAQRPGVIVRLQRLVGQLLVGERQSGALKYKISEANGNLNTRRKQNPVLGEAICTDVDFIVTKVSESVGAAEADAWVRCDDHACHI